MVRIIVLVLLVLTACVRPQVEVCNVAKACVINICTTGDTCVAKPLELKAPL